MLSGEVSGYVWVGGAGMPFASVGRVTSLVVSGSVVAKVGTVAWVVPDALADGVVASVVSEPELSLPLLNSIYAMIPPSIRIAAAAMMIATMIGALLFCCCL